jgi:hypothetical protein
VDVAQSVRAPGCGPGGRGFESPHSPQILMLGAEAPAPVAQLDRAADFGSEGYRFESCRARHDGASPSGKASAFGADMRRFESCRPSQVWAISSVVEHPPFKRGVDGSSPSWPTMLYFLQCLLGTVSWITLQTPHVAYHARVSEPADELDLGSSALNGVGVQIPSLAPLLRPASWTLIMSTTLYTVRCGMLS